MAEATRLNTQGVLAMRGGGYYSARTRGAKDVIDKGLPLVKAAVPPQPGADGVLRCADFGCADGGTSREMWFELIRGLRDAGDTRQIQLTFTDLAANDWTSLFRLMQGLVGEPRQALQEVFDGVFVHGCGTGFHRQLLPDATLDLGFSATAMHYLSEAPVMLSEHVHMVGATSREREAFARQAAADWERILTARTHELKPGGRLVVLNFGIDEEGRYLGATGGVNMFDTFNRLWRDLADAERITEEEFRRATFMQYYRTLEEVTAPLHDAGSPVHRAGLRLVDAFTEVTPCPYARTYADAGDGMTTRDYARSLVPTLRSWSETVFKTALDRRPPEEAQALVDSFYQAYEDLVADDPTGHAMDYVHVVLVVEKV